MMAFALVFLTECFDFQTAVFQFVEHTHKKKLTQVNSTLNLIFLCCDLLPESNSMQLGNTVMLS